MPPRHAIAIDLGRRRLRALWGAYGGGTLDVRRQITADVPKHVDADDADAVGRWVGFQLRQAGFPAGKATLALAREHVSVKRLTLPSVDADELPGMARLALRRELTFDPDHAVIDFVPIDQDEASTTVIAVAAPDQVLAFQREMAKSAGVGVGRISLRSKGTATLIAQQSDGAAGSVLAIDVTGDGVEFCVVADGSVLFARAAELPDFDDPHTVAQAVVTETRRTWMSYRIAQESREVTSAVVVGPASITPEIITRVQETLGVPTAPLASHRLVSDGGRPLETLWPLAGLLLEPMLGTETFDFAHPRRAPDRRAHLRQRVIMAAGLALVAMLAGWTVGRVKLERLREDLASVRTQRTKMYPQYLRYGRDQVQLQHLAQWESVQVDWLEHAAYLLTVSPPPNRLVLDSWTGGLSFRGVRYDGKAEPAQRWSAPREVTIVLDGEAVDRATADAFRESLVEGDLYVTSSAGTDAQGGRRLPFGFTYRLRTARGTVFEADAEQMAGEPGTRGATEATP